MSLKDIYLCDTLKTLEGMCFEDIQYVLNIIANFTKDEEYPIYPFYELVDENGKKIRKLKEANSKDGIKVADTIISKLFSFLQREVSRLREEIYDIDNFCEELKNSEQKELLLKKIDDTYSYLEKVPVYNHIYISFRNDYIKLLIRHIRQVQSKVMLHKSDSIDAQLRQIKPVKSGRTLQKLVNNKPQRKNQF